jgi:hypothetical protein
VELNAAKCGELTRGLVFVSLVAISVAVRLLSETPNFNAVTAAALFAGFYFRSRWTALAVPVLAMSISDVFLGGYSKPMMAAVYFSLCVPIAWRTVLRRNLSPLTVGGGALSSSLTAFVLSNFAVWYAWYPQTVEGLTSCYVRAIPFLANAMKSDLLFAAGFFGLYAVVTHLGKQPSHSLSTEVA